MRKGDEKRQEMLNVAERLFCLKGYEATSVQDILHVLHISKGGFYHHFSSKEELLETLFYQRAEKALTATEGLLATETDVMKRLNLLFYGFLPLKKDGAEFVAMLLPMLDKLEGRGLRLCYQEALEKTFHPAMERELALAQDADVIMPADEDVADVVLLLLNKLWVDGAVLLLEGIKNAQKPEAAALMNVLNKARCCLERLLDAPYGSVEIVDLNEWDELVETMTQRLLLPMQG